MKVTFVHSEYYEMEVDPEKYSFDYYTDLLEHCDSIWDAGVERYAEDWSNLTWDEREV